MKLITLMIGIFIAGLFITLILGLPNQNNNCQSNNEKFIKTGIVSNVEWLGGSILIDFEDDSYLYIHGSPDNKYSIDDLDNILVVGANYSFNCHYDCVMSDGNEPYWFEGVVIDKLIVN